MYTTQTPKEIGLKLRLLRNGKQLSRLELAEELDGITEGMIKQWEDGRVEIRFSSLLKFCNFYKIKINHFL